MRRRVRPSPTRGLPSFKRKAAGIRAKRGRESEGQCPSGRGMGVRPPSSPHREAIQKESSQGAKRYLTFGAAPTPSEAESQKPSWLHPLLLRHIAPPSPRVPTSRNAPRPPTPRHPPFPLTAANFRFPCPARARPQETPDFSDISGGEYSSPPALFFRMFRNSKPAQFFR